MDPSLYPEADLEKQFLKKTGSASGPAPSKPIEKLILTVLKILSPDPRPGPGPPGSQRGSSTVRPKRRCLLGRTRTNKHVFAIQKRDCIAS